jgi:hypothetical protein
VTPGVKHNVIIVRLSLEASAALLRLLPLGVCAPRVLLRGIQLGGEFARALLQLFHLLVQGFDGFLPVSQYFVRNRNLIK